MHQNSIKIILLPESTSFDEARASVASALTFNRHDAVARPSTKKNKAPNPPTAVANDDTAEKKKIAETDEKSDSCNSSSASSAAATTTTTKREGDSTPTMPPSALRNANRSSGNGEKPARVVQFSPDTKTTSTQPTATPVPYNKWIANAGVFESSFTGQPVKVAPVNGAAPTATVSRRPVKSANAAATASAASSVTTPTMSPVTPG